MLGASATYNIRLCQIKFPNIWYLIQMVFTFCDNLRFWNNYSRTCCTLYAVFFYEYHMINDLTLTPVYRFQFIIICGTVLFFVLPFAPNNYDYIIIQLFYSNRFTYLQTFSNSRQNYHKSYFKISCCCYIVHCEEVIKTT